MAKIIARFSLAAFGMLNQLGMYWFVFGIWPQSWLAFFAFFCTTALLLALTMAISDDD